MDVEKNYINIDNMNYIIREVYKEYYKYINVCFQHTYYFAFLILI